MYNFNRLENETPFEWKLRLCKAKLNKDIDLDWSEIADTLELDVSADHLRKTAYGLMEYDNYIHNCEGASERILCISDIHIPFNLPVDIFASYKGIVDTIIINGDLLDCFSCSSFPKKFKVNLDEELVLGRQYIIDLINMISPKKVMFTMGNHEFRMQRYYSDRLSNELLGITPTDPLRMIIDKGFEVKDERNKTQTQYSSIREVFEDTNIEIIYEQEWWIKEGNVIFCHPLNYSSGMLKTTEKAVNYFLRVDRTFTGIVMGHTHKIGSFTQGGIKMYEQGCVCDLNKLDYNNGKLIIPNQNGFMYIALNSDGDIIDSKTRIITLD
nr:MAG TPA: Calcineurin-like phosphoesterase [Caudoviricetes sp.]